MNTNTEEFLNVQKAFKQIGEPMKNIYRSLIKVVKIAIETETNKQKYLKRVKNRQILHEKRKALGRD